MPKRAYYHILADVHRTPMKKLVQPNLYTYEKSVFTLTTLLILFISAASSGWAQVHSTQTGTNTLNAATIMEKADAGPYMTTHIDEYFGLSSEGVASLQDDYNRYSVSCTQTEYEDFMLALEDALYDLQGRRVSQTTKGIYIVNGKKAVLK